MEINLIERSNQLFQKAERLNKTFPFKDLALKHFGNITYVGSATTNLMVEPDIDSNIILKPMNIDTVVAFAEDLTSIKECRKVILYNRTYEEVPYFIINVERFSFEDETWTLTFFIEESDYTNTIQSTRDIMANLTEEKRKIILELKDFRLKNKYKRCIAPVVLYDAVFKGSVADVESFKEYLDGIGVALRSED